VGFEVFHCGEDLSQGFPVWDAM